MYFPLVNFYLLYKYKLVINVNVGKINNGTVICHMKLGDLSTKILCMKMILQIWFDQLWELCEKCDLLEGIWELLTAREFRLSSRVMHLKFDMLLRSS